MGEAYPRKYRYYAAKTEDSLLLCIFVQMCMKYIINIRISET